MPLMLTRRDGSVTPFRNSEYLPFYYFIPESILRRCGAELNAIPRNPRMIFSNRAACKFIESDLFMLLIYDATANLVWKYMGYDEYMEIYSGYDPAWKLAHSPNYWIKGLTDEGIIQTVEELYRNCHSDLGFLPEYDIDIYLRYVVPKVMEQHNMYAAIETAEQFRCFEDFDFRDSRQKTDFYRKWYHTRTKHPMIFLEEFKENYSERHNGQEWDMPDESQDLDLYATDQVMVEQFKAKLSEKDMQILTLRMEGKTLEEIAEMLGYKNHSGVLKRIRKIGKMYEEYANIDFGFQDRKII